MARAKVVHSTDACTIIFEGDKKSPEPTMGAIKFPGGSVEVSRASDGSYWVHMNIDGEVIDSRVDYHPEKYAELVKAGEETIPNIAAGEAIQHIAVRV